MFVHSLFAQGEYRMAGRTHGKAESVVRENFGLARAVRTVALVAVIAAAAPGRADVILDWNALMVDAIRADNTAANVATRNFAILHTAIWDAVNSVSQTHQPYAFLGVYMPLANQVFERIIFYMRSRFGSNMLKAGKMKLEMEAWKDRQYLIVLGADQSPPGPLHAHWLYFMNRPAGFVQRPWQKARELNQR